MAETTETATATGETAADAMRLGFLQLQVLHEVSGAGVPEGLRAGLHVEANGVSGVHLPAGYAGEEADRHLRAYTATMLRRIADALDAHAATAQMPVIVTSADQD